MGQIASIGGKIAGITITPRGAVVEGTPLEHTYAEAMRQIASAERTCKFALGDLLNAAAGHYGDRYAHWSEVTGLEVETLWNVASVCRRVPMANRRVDALSFSHHAEVAALPVQDQEKWLTVAAEKEVPVQRLRKSIKLGRVASSADMAPSSQGAAGAVSPDGVATVQGIGEARPPADPGYDNVHPHVNRLVAYLAKKERDGEYEDMDGSALYRFHLDVLPVVKRWARVLSMAAERGDEDVRRRMRAELLEIGLAYVEEGAE